MTRLLTLIAIPLLTAAAVATPPTENTKLPPERMAEIQAMMTD